MRIYQLDIMLTVFKSKQIINTLSCQTLIPDTEPPDCSTLAEKQKTESMANLLDELNRMSLLIDKDKNPQWEFIMQGSNINETFIVYCQTILSGFWLVYKHLDLSKDDDKFVNVFSKFRNNNYSLDKFVKQNEN